MDEIVDVECYSCNQKVSVDDSVTLDSGEFSCNDCSRYCDRCEIYFPSDDAWSIDGEIWCENCRDHYSFYCNSCDEYYSLNGDYFVVSGDYICLSCGEDDLTYCDYHEDYEWNDRSCRHNNRDVIKSYGYKPEPIFHGVDKHSLFMGWELEVSLPNERDDTMLEFAKYAHEKFEPNDIAYLKYDSSVRSGFEIVTHPYAHNTLRELDDYWDTIEHLRSNGFRSWDTDFCGLHIHLSRKGFNNGSHTHRFLQLIYSNAEQVAKFGGRASCSYADFRDVWQFDNYGKPYRSYKQKIRRRGSRHTAVNTCPDETIELRFFRGTLRKQSILAALDFAHAAVEYTRTLTAKDVIDGALSWDMFMLWVEDNNGIYPDLYVKGNKIHNVNLDKHALDNA